jgi:hypothetical protein
LSQIYYISGILGDKKGNNSKRGDLRVAYSLRLYILVHLSIVPAHGRGRPGYFCLGKSNQNRSQQKCFFAARTIAAQTGQNQGCNLFAGLIWQQPTRHAKICYAPQPHKATIVLPGFGRSLSVEKGLT